MERKIQLGEYCVCQQRVELSMACEGGPGIEKSPKVGSRPVFWKRRPAAVMMLQDRYIECGNYTSVGSQGLDTETEQATDSLLQAPFHCTRGLLSS